MDPRHGDAWRKVVLCLVWSGHWAGLSLLAVAFPGPGVGGRAPWVPEAGLRGSLEVLALSPWPVLGPRGPFTTTASTDILWRISSHVFTGILCCCKKLFF